MPERRPLPWAWNRSARILLVLTAGTLGATLAGLVGDDLPAPTPLPTFEVDANTAPQAVLEALPGLGPSRAAAIVDAREARPFRSLAELDRRVKGIGPVTAAALEAVSPVRSRPPGPLIRPHPGDDPGAAETSCRTSSSRPPISRPATSPGRSTSWSAAIKEGKPHQTLLGVTGSGKTFTMANVIARLGKPALVMSHNKTLAAQLYGEFKEFFPHNAVRYFVSYYDYYQPEAYIPQRDIYIEKDSSINEEIERLRLACTSALVSRNDVIVIASVSCIYGLGSPDDYRKMMVKLKLGQTIDRDEMLLRFVDIQYDRNDVDFARGKFRVRGDVVELWPAYEEVGFRIELFGDEVETLAVIDPDLGRGAGEEGGDVRLPGQALRPARGADQGGRRGDPRRARRAPQAAQGARQAPRSPAARGPDAVRHRDAPGGRLLLGDRELQPPPLRPEAGRDAEHAARLLPARQPPVHRRVARQPRPDPRDVRRRLQPQDRPWSSTASASPAPSTTARSGSTSGRRSSASGSSSRPPPATTRSPCPAARSSSRSSAPPACSTRSSASSPPGARSPRCWPRPEADRQGRARPDHHPDQAPGRGPVPLPQGARAQAASGSTPSSTPSSG